VVACAAEAEAVSHSGGGYVADHTQFVIGDVVAIEHQPVEVLYCRRVGD
jgi:hypothetical protein